MWTRAMSVPECCMSVGARVWHSLSSPAHKHVEGGGGGGVAAGVGKGVVAAGAKEEAVAAAEEGAVRVGEVRWTGSMSQ